MCSGKCSPNGAKSYIVVSKSTLPRRSPYRLYIELSEVQNSAVVSVLGLGVIVIEFLNKTTPF